MAPSKVALRCVRTQLCAYVLRTHNRVGVAIYATYSQDDASHDFFSFICWKIVLDLSTVGGSRKGGGRGAAGEDTKSPGQREELSLMMLQQGVGTIENYRGRSYNLAEGG